MSSDFDIGRVVAVDTSQVTIELNADLKALTRSTYERTVEVGRINSYVIIPVGARKIVAMVTRVVMTEEAELRTDKTMVSLPTARRLMKATMIGTIDGDDFKQGISLFPVLDSAVRVASKGDLNAIFGCKICDPATCKKAAKRADYCINVGTAVVFPDHNVRINPDIFFGKHAAIIGSTGSGKSCTVATIIQSVLTFGSVRNARFIILDTNGEYNKAFPASSYHSLYIPTDPMHPDERLVIPYWFMNSEDFVRLFRAKEGLQAPVLKRALGLARTGSSVGTNSDTIGTVLLAALNRIRAHCENDAPKQQWAIPDNIKADCDDSLRYEQAYPDRWAKLEDAKIASTVRDGLTEILTVATQANTGQQKGLGATRIQQIFDAIERIKEALENAGLIDINAVSGGQSSPDIPSYFNLADFITSTIDLAMKEQSDAGSPARVREACGPMMLRIHRYLTDPRFDFIFGGFQTAEHVLAKFLRDILGMSAVTSIARANDCSESSDLDETLDSKNGITEQCISEMPFLRRQESTNQKTSEVVIIDLSLLASEVLENVTALIGRLILEFLQRLGETGSNVSRGDFPVVLVLEEAQNYIKVPRGLEDDSISRDVFEKIAREGRKYGLGLVVASQRPSELSKTVLSQCNSFIVHRLQNPEDLRYFREIVPGVYDELLDQLPALAPRNALILGESVRAPVMTYMREANPTPESKDPSFYKHWISESPEWPNVEVICERWEGKSIYSPNVSGDCRYDRE